MFEMSKWRGYFELSIVIVVGLYCQYFSIVKSTNFDHRRIVSVKIGIFLMVLLHRDSFFMFHLFSDIYFIFWKVYQLHVP